MNRVSFILNQIQRSSPPSMSRDRDGIGRYDVKCAFKTVLLNTMPKDSMRSTAKPGLGQGLKNDAHRPVLRKGN